MNNLSSSNCTSDELAAATEFKNHALRNSQLWTFDKGMVLLNTKYRNYPHTSRYGLYIRKSVCVAKLFNRVSFLRFGIRLLAHCLKWGASFHQWTQKHKIQPWWASAGWVELHARGKLCGPSCQLPKSMHFPLFISMVRLSCTEISRGSSRNRIDSRKSETQHKLKYGSNSIIHPTFS